MLPAPLCHPVNPFSDDISLLAKKSNFIRLLSFAFPVAFTSFSGRETKMRAKKQNHVYGRKKNIRVYKCSFRAHTQLRKH